MAQHSEPMDVDCMVSDFDNKENTFHNNVPCTEKGYEELDVAELNMKLRYSKTPASSSMSKSYTTYSDNRHLETGDTLHENASLTRSLNSTINKNDNVIKSLKSLPLQSISTDQFTDGNGNSSILRQLDSTDNANITVTISGSNDMDENLSLPSSSSSALHTPEATTPTKEMKDSSPIMRGLKSVLNMFRSSTSPVPPMEGDIVTVKQKVFSPGDVKTSENTNPHDVASAPIVMPLTKDGNTSKRSSPYKESIVFNDDLEKQLNWKETKSDSSPERSPVNKLLLHNSKSPKPTAPDLNSSNLETNYHSLVEYMDISNNGSILQDKTVTELLSNHEVSAAAESDCEFMDCETTCSKNESYVLDVKAVQDIISPIPDEIQNISCTNNTDIVDCDSTFSKNESYVLDIKGVQEIISPTVNLDETQPVSYINKTLHVADCDSTLSTINESYVLDIKDIQEKISPKLDPAKMEPISNQKINNTLLNETTDGNFTNFTFANLDMNLDMTVPSDYSDYSQATTDILTELEKLEANANKHTYGNKTEQLKNITDQVIPFQNMTGVVGQIEITQIDKSETMESQEALLNNSENKTDELENTLTEQNVKILQSITPTTSNASENIIDTTSNETTTESENTISESQDVNLTQENPNDLCKNEVEIQSQETANQTLDTTIIKGAVIVEGKNDIGDEVISHKLIETPVVITEPVPTISSDSVGNDAKFCETLNVTENYIPLETVKNMEIANVPSQDSSVAQTDIAIDVMNSTVKENVLSNDFNHTENDTPVDIVSNIQKTDVSSEMFDTTQNNFNDVEVEQLQNPVPNVIEPLEILDVTTIQTDVQLTNNNFANNLDQANASLVVSDVTQNNVIVDTLQNRIPDNVVESLQTVNETNTEKCDNPSDLPLPDDDDVDKEVLNIFVNNVVACTSETIVTLPEFTEISSELSVDNVFEHNNGTTFTSDILETRVSELEQPVSVNNQPSDGIPSETKIIEIMIPEKASTLSENIPILSEEHPSPVTQPDKIASEMEPEKASTLSENIPILSEEHPSSITVTQPDKIASEIELNEIMEPEKASMLSENIPILSEEHPSSVTVTQPDGIVPEIELSEIMAQEKACMLSENIPILLEAHPSSVTVTQPDGVASEIELNEIMEPEKASMLCENIPILSEKHPSSGTNDLNSTSVGDKMICAVVPENEINNENVISNECTPSNNDSQVNENIVCNMTENIEESQQCAENFNNDTVKLDITVHEPNPQIEPMDISMNESLNLSHKSHHFANQFIPSAEESTQNQSSKNITDTEPKGAGMAFNSSNVYNNEELEKMNNVIEDVTCQPDLENNFDVSMKIISDHEHSIISENTHVIDLHLKCEKQPACAAENNHVDNLAVELNNEKPPRVFTNTDDSESMEVEKTTADEEIIVSANNSPYVSVMSGIDTVAEKNEEPFEEIENPFVASTNVSSSPPITSKGYNFNFDEIDDPFATKTKIRLSPPLDSPGKDVETNDVITKPIKIPGKVPNRRQSQPPERKKPLPLKKKLNSTFDSKSTPKMPTNKIINKNITDGGISTEHKEVLDIAENESSKGFEATPSHADSLNTNVGQREPNVPKSTESHLQSSTENKTSLDSVPAVSSDLKVISSSEQSTYYSAGGSSTDSFQSKNVFNLPEIDDVNFNPFVSKSKMRQSPPPDTDIANPFATRPKMCQSPSPTAQVEDPFATKTKLCSSPDVSMINHTQSDINHTMSLDEAKLTELVRNIEVEEKMETEIMEKNTSANITDTTSSSNTTDIQNSSTHEVNTEDEDTIEGPFLDADDIEKTTEVADNDDLMQFNELHDAAQVIEDNPDGELFIDAEAFEFLLNQNKSNVVADSGKESLFLKFDPLFAKRISSDTVLAALNKAQKKQSTPTKPSRPSLRNIISPIAGPSTLNETYESDNNISQDSTEDGNITVTKPMMVVTPALNPAVTPRNKSITPAISNRRSITFTSPAIAVIDRLLSMSANNSGLGHDSSITSTQSHGEQTEADLALTQLRELLAEKEISVYNLRTESKELKDRLSTMESQVRILESDGQERLKKINELNERLAEKTKMNKSMAAVVEEYERTIASLIADIEQDKKRNAEERIRLINERDEQTAHLSSMEVSFSDLHSKYEKSKQVILTCKANEDVMKKTIKDFEEQVTKMQNNYEMLKQHATAKLNHANQELEKINRAHDAEVVKLNAMIKRNQLLATSLQETLAQKTKANDELTAICDELINKVGSSK